ncbi:MAG TPA: hypothetical protein VK534_00825 [Methylomirabilota bacterium]|nr:hypothetical protein [Methylomirabilota bacterium]
MVTRELKYESIEDRPTIQQQDLVVMREVLRQILEETSQETDSQFARFEGTEPGIRRYAKRFGVEDTPPKCEPTYMFGVEYIDPDSKSLQWGSYLAIAEASGRLVAHAANYARGTGLSWLQGIGHDTSLTWFDLDHINDEIVAVQEHPALA